MAWVNFASSPVHDTPHKRSAGVDIIHLLDQIIPAARIQYKARFPTVKQPSSKENTEEMRLSIHWTTFHFYLILYDLQIMG
jgi:hypothetical protein